MHHTALLSRGGTAENHWYVRARPAASRGPAGPRAGGPRAGGARAARGRREGRRSPRAGGVESGGRGGGTEGRGRARNRGPASTARGSQPAVPGSLRAAAFLGPKRPEQGPERVNRRPILLPLQWYVNIGTSGLRRAVRGERRATPARGRDAGPARGPAGARRAGRSLAQVDEDVLDLGVDSSACIPARGPMPDIL